MKNNEATIHTTQTAATVTRHVGYGVTRAWNGFMRMTSLPVPNMKGTSNGLQQIAILLYYE
jgi:hypothetical protein